MSWIGRKLNVELTIYDVIMSAVTACAHLWRHKSVTWLDKIIKKKLSKFEVSSKSESLKVKSLRKMIKATTNRHKPSNLVLIWLLPPVWWVRQVFNSLRSDFRLFRNFSKLFDRLQARMPELKFWRITVLDQSGPIRSDLACQKCWHYRKVSKKLTF